MADLTDVENTLVTLVQSAVYPNGTASPSIINAGIRIYAGWPIPAGLDHDLTNGITNISIFSTNMERNTTRFQKDWQDSIINIPTITLTVSNVNNTVIVSGTISTPQNCMVIVNSVGYSYAVQSNDTLNTIASGIAALIGNGASSLGAVITIPSAYRISANVGVSGTSVRELRRQEKVFQITIWAPQENYRTSIASAIDVLFEVSERITLPDNFSARLKYHSTKVIDMLEKQKIYRRDLMYSIEYATTQTETDYTVSDSFINSLELYPTGQSISE